MAEGVSRYRRASSVALVAGLFFGLLTIGPEPTSARPKKSPISPPGKIWVVDANVKEHDRADIKDHQDMRNFVKRTMFMTRWNAPDVILLQEVNWWSARWLERAFERRTGHGFRVISGPPGTIRTEMKRGFLRRDDSAILMNSSSMRLLSNGKFHVRHRRDAASRRPMWQMVPWARMIEKGRRGNRLQAAVASVHYPRHSTFENRSQSHRHKARWSRQLARLLDMKMPDRGVGDGRVSVITGDFNAHTCSTEDRPCVPNEHWRALTKLRYRDALRVCGWREYFHRIDFMFTKANIADVLWDHQQSVSWVNSWPQAYSDHPLITALIEDEDTTPPLAAEEKIRVEFEDNDLELFWGSSRGMWRWTHEGGWDGGVGLSHWLLYRRETEEQPWTLIASPKTGHYIDKDFDSDGSRLFQYRVAAVDRAGNVSSFSPVKTQREPCHSHQC